MVRPLATVVVAGIPGGTSKYMINVYIIAKNGSAIACFTETRLVFVEKTLTADVVVFATGYVHFALPNLRRTHTIYFSTRVMSGPQVVDKVEQGILKRSEVKF